jgi:hypothetical protein
MLITRVNALRDQTTKCILRQFMRGAVALLVTQFWAPSWAAEHDSGSCKTPLGIPGGSYYCEFKTKYLPADLPVQLGLAGTSESDWATAIFGLTLFTEARNENDNSFAAVAAGILRRAGYGGAGFDELRIPHVAANRAYSQWLLAHEILSHKSPEWIKANLVATQSKVSLDEEQRENVLIVRDPPAYAKEHAKRGFPKKLATSIQLARCIIDDLHSSQGKALDWVNEFGTMFSAPMKIYTKSVFHDHETYLSDVALSYCPSSSAHGPCPMPAHFDDTKHQGVGAPFHYYQLSSPHSEEAIVKLNEQVSAFVARCQSAEAGAQAPHD